MIINTMNQRNKMETEGVVCGVKCSECNTIYVRETERKLKTRL